MSEKVVRSYKSSTPPAYLGIHRSLSKDDRIVLGVIMTIAFVVRIYGIGWPSSVVFDEVHFGGFARKYIIGRFFFDVHPPLAKMLFAVVGYLGGLSDDFEFKNIGDDYIRPEVPYVTMRLLPAIMGLLTIALCYSTLRASGCRTAVAALGSLLLTFENTHATESRYILLDSPLLFFVAITVYGYKKSQLAVPFTRDWYRFLALTGLGLGATVSSKWVGLFTIAWVGLETVYQLWWVIGDLSLCARSISKHFAVRVGLLIVLPAAFYLSMFYLHFLCVDNYGDGADFMPRAFSSTLKHNSLPYDIPANVGFNSTITLRHVGTSGGYLHSHPHMYETGSKQQQITLYPHIDENNKFTIENGTENWNPNNETGPVWLKDGDVIRLYHAETSKRLHSHDHRPPVSTHDYLFEVSGYGFEGFDGDGNDNWRIKIIDSESTGEGKNTVQALRTTFQLQHTLTGCLLYSKKIKLPDWGFEQQEVSCIRPGRGENTLWYVEHNSHPEYTDPELVSYEKPSFLRKVIDIHKAMWNVNKGLTEPHNWESRPLSWLTLRRGINMWGKHNRQIYLTGNLPIYLTITVSIVLFFVWKVLQVLVWQRYGSPGEGLPELVKGGSVNSDAAGLSAWGLFEQQYSSFMLGWFLHYVPSFLMVRQLFLHHYLASLYFGILAISQIFELLFAVVPWKRVAYVVSGAYLTAAVAWYVWYSPLIYGFRWTKQTCLSSIYHDMDFDCNTFLGSKDAYDAIDASLSASSLSAKLGLPEETAEPEITADQVIPPADANAEAEAQDGSEQQAEIPEVRMV